MHLSSADLGMAEGVLEETDGHEGCCAVELAPWSESSDRPGAFSEPFWFVHSLGWGRLVATEY